MKLTTELTPPKARRLAKGVKLIQDVLDTLPPGFTEQRISGRPFDSERATAAINARWKRKATAEQGGTAA